MLRRRENQFVREHATSVLESMKKTSGPGINKLSQITSHLFVCNWQTAVSVKNLASEKIKHALCFSTRDTDRLEQKFRKNKIALTVVSIPNNNDVNLTEIFGQNYMFVKTRIEKGEKIVMFCDDGISLSPAMTCSYLLYRYYYAEFEKSPEKITLQSNMFVQRVVEFVKQSRQCILILDNFVLQLVYAEVQLKKFFSEKHKLKLDKKKSDLREKTKRDKAKYQKREKSKKPKKSAQPKKIRKPKEKQTQEKNEFDELRDIPEREKKIENSFDEEEILDASIDFSLEEDIDSDVEEDLVEDAEEDLVEDLEELDAENLSLDLS